MKLPTLVLPLVLGLVPLTETAGLAAPATHATDLAKLVKVGTTFVVEMADHDADDAYTLHVDNLTKGLTWTWSLAGAHDRGTVSTDDASLKTAHTVAFIGQGNVSPSRKEGISTPPFLLGRDQASGLRQGKASAFSVYDVKDGQLKLAGTEARSVKVDGKATAVAATKATDGKTTIWFVDDPVWPILVAATFDGNNFITLTEIHTK